MTVTLTVPDPAAMHRLGARLAGLLRPGDVLALAGALGAGKTELVRGLLRHASGDPELVVPSPSFTLVECYETPFGLFWHFDLYRLGAPQEVWELGFEEALASGISLIEWPENLGALMPATHLEIRLLEIDPAGVRQAMLLGHGGWSQRLAEWTRS